VGSDAADLEGDRKTSGGQDADRGAIHRNPTAMPPADCYAQANLRDPPRPGQLEIQGPLPFPGEMFPANNAAGFGINSTG
jgi:hypothetical protein